RYLTVMGRLEPGASLETAEAELNAVARRLDEEYPESNEGWRVRLVSAQEQVVGRAGAVLVVVLIAVGFVLLLACANVANLLLGRAAVREGEMAVRTALGASRGRLRSQLVAESVVLGLLAGALGALIAYAAVRGFIALEPQAIPRASEVSVDARVLAFTFLASLCTGVFFGLVPAARALTADPSIALREGGRSVGGQRKERARRVLIISQVAGALVLLVGAGLALRSLVRLRAIDPGYATENVTVARVDLDGPNYRGAEPKVRYFEQLRERIAAIPGVASAAVTSTLPLTPAGIDFNLPYHAEGEPLVPEEQALQDDYRIIGPGYLETMGIELLRGRDFNGFDRADSKRVMIVNRAFAEQHWPGEDPIGKLVRLYYTHNWDYEVVGMVDDTRHNSLSVPGRLQMFVPLPQAEVLFGYMTIAVRTRGDITGLEARIRAEAIALDPNEPLYNFETIEQLLGNATARERLAAIVFGAFAVLAIVLSAAGIYG
ncbi:MAG: FtsX-like permease family protein, partial [Longimicrobiales bacterium]